MPKPLRGWMSPDNLLQLLNKDTDAGNRALKQMPFDLLRDKDGLNLRDYQLRAIQAAEQAIINGKPSVLLAMATGTRSKNIPTTTSMPLETILPTVNCSARWQLSSSA